MSMIFEKDKLLKFIVEIEVIKLIAEWHNKKYNEIYRCVVK